MSQIIITNGKVGVFNEIKFIEGSAFDHYETKSLTPTGLREFVQSLLEERIDLYENDFVSAVQSNTPIYRDESMYSWEKSGSIIVYSSKTFELMKKLLEEVKQAKYVDLLVPTFTQKEKSVLIACMCESGCVSAVDRQYMGWLRHLLEL